MEIKLPQFAIDSGMVHPSTIKDGIYKGLHYAHCLELLNGTKIYTSIGVRHTKRFASVKEYHIKDGKVYDGSNCLSE